MTRPADTEQTPSVAHGGSRRGDCLLCTPAEYRELIQLRRQIRAAVIRLRLRAENARLREALGLIMLPGCETTTVGNCWEMGRVRGARYSADAWCDPCIAVAALRGLDYEPAAPHATIDS
jgi:hypothetical protein